MYCNFVSLIIGIAYTGISIFAIGGLPNWKGHTQIFDNKAILNFIVFSMIIRFYASNLIHVAEATIRVGYYSKH